MHRLLCGGMIFITGVAWGSAISLTSNLPPDSGEYRTADQVHADYASEALFELDNIRHHFFLNIAHPPCGPGCEMDQFDSTLDADLFLDDVSQGHVVMTGQVLVQVFNKNVGNPGTPFPTEMLQLNLSGVTPFGPILIRESPTLASLGQTQIDALGNGTFQIDSFFDVFTELSLDSGATWIPSNGSSQVSLHETPEPGTFVLSGLALVGLGFLTRRRRAGR